MRGAALPGALLCAVLAMALSHAPRRTQALAVAAAIAAACGVASLTLPPAWTEIAFAGCWLTLILAGAAVYFPRSFGANIYLPVGAICGGWTGAIIALEGAPADLARALPALALVIPGTWLVHKGWGIALKVATSWAVAIALLAALLPTITATPGYRPDHME